MSLCNLPDEILLIIFNYCDAHDITQLNCVCKRFYNIASEVLIKKSNNLLVTGQNSEKFRERCQPLLSSYKEKFYIHNNWKHGRYRSKIFYPEPVPKFRCSRSCIEDKYRHRLKMKKDVILFLNYYNLCAYTRTKNGLVSDDNVIVAKCSNNVYDIYVPCNDIIVTYHRDGSIRQWTIESLDGRKYFNEKLICSAYSNKSEWLDPYTIDVTLQNIVIGSDKDGEITIWKYIPQENSITDKYIIFDRNSDPDLDEQVMNFITFDSTGTKFAAGMSYNLCNGRFIIYDINKCCTEKYIKPKDWDSDLDDVDQILWEEPNDILHLTYDKIIKMDVRTHKVVQKWNVPLVFNDMIGLYHEDRQERLTCMSTDNQYAIMTGTSHGKFTLWDQRKSDFIKVYNNNNVDCVDCLQFDSSHMYVAADRIYEFDFLKI